VAVNSIPCRDNAIVASAPLIGPDNQRIRVLDGFRGIAVLLVMCYHFIPAIFFGWAGVDLFFILSGFLITSILLRTVGTPGFLYVYFSRRLLRIVPLYFVMLFILFVLFPVMVPSMVTPAYDFLVEHQYWYWLFSVNISFALHGFPENITVVHFWSLACEMQFYLVWPLLILLFHKSRKVLWIVLSLLFLFAVFFRVYADQIVTMNSLYRYVLLPSRLDAFAAGGILFLYTSSDYRISGKVLYWMSGLFFTLIVLSGVLGIHWHFTDSFTQRYGLSLNVLFWISVLSICLQNPSSIPARFTGSRLLQNAGLYSYGMYVFHLPVTIFVDKLFFPPAVEENTGMMLLRIFLLFTITIIISVASFHLFEKKMMLFKPRYHVADN